MFYFISRSLLIYVYYVKEATLIRGVHQKGRQQDKQLQRPRIQLNYIIIIDTQFPIQIITNISLTCSYKVSRSPTVFYTHPNTIIVRRKQYKEYYFIISLLPQTKVLALQNICTLLHLLVFTSIVLTALSSTILTLYRRRRRVIRKENSIVV